MRKLIVTAIVLSGLWIAVSPAAGAFPSVNSATDQYVEYIPGVTGRDDADSDSGARKPGPSSLPQEVIEELEQQGADGAAAAILALSSAPPANRDDAGKGPPGNRGQGGSSGDSAATAPASPGQDTETSGFSAVFSNLVGSGMGMILPILLLLTVVGVISLRIIEARRGSGKPQG